MNEPRTNPPDLDAIRARADKATPGPWRSWAQGNQYVYAFGGRRNGDPPEPEGIDHYLPTARPVHAAIIPELARPWNPHAVMAFGTMDQAWQARFHDDDAEFIAHAREDIPALLAEIERLREALAHSQATIGLATTYIPAARFGEFVNRRAALAEEPRA